jgi:ABC-2 type transport system permease protein
VAQLGPIDHGATVSGYLGLLFVSAVYVSIGLFASSLTGNQIVAFLLSLFVAAFLHLLFGQMASILPGPVANVAEFLDLQGHFRTMSRGVLDAASVLYVLSLTALGLLAATVSLKSRRWS